jgi:hypothetical protein
MINVPNKDTMLVIDYDILLYEFGFGMEKVDDWYTVQVAIDKFHKRLFDKFGTYNYTGYLNGDSNFREVVAVTHPYKGTRKSEKPKWYKDIKDYLSHCYNTEFIHGAESDDGMSIAITSNPNSICCSRDKDLRTTSGWHYSWATKTTKEKPLEFIDAHGYLEYTEKSKGSNALTGGGNMLLYSQALTGDKVDNIVGITGVGLKGAFTLLKKATTERELYDIVLLQYQEKEDKPLERLHENMNLLYMVRGYDDKGELIMWEIPECLEP